MFRPLPGVASPFRAAHEPYRKSEYSELPQIKISKIPVQPVYNEHLFFYRFVELHHSEKTCEIPVVYSYVYIYIYIYMRGVLWYYVEKSDACACVCVTHDAYTRHM